MGINMCQGICTSQLDDYCGMFMDGEECPACKSIWETAHAENEKQKLETTKDIRFLGLTTLTIEKILREEAKLKADKETK